MARPKGSRNKTTQAAHAMLDAAFDELGGKDFLVRVGRKYPTLFVNVWARAKLPRPLSLELEQASIESLLAGIARQPDPDETPSATDEGEEDAAA